MYIAAPEYIWTIIAAILIAIFMLLVQKWFYNGKIYRTKEADRQAILKCLIATIDGLNDILGNKNTTNKKEDTNDKKYPWGSEDDDEDEDLDDIIDDFLK